MGEQPDESLVTYAEIWINGVKTRVIDPILIVGPDSFQSAWLEHGEPVARTGVAIIMKFFDRPTRKLVAFHHRNLQSPKGGVC